MMGPYRLAVLALLLLPLGACGGTPARPTAAVAEPGAAESAAQQACREEAQNSPEIRRLGAQVVPGDLLNERRLAAQERALFSRAYRNCLHARGLPMSGGVERPIRR
jgi:hypothetical protein